MISCGRERWYRFTQIKLRCMAGELIHPWGRTVKVYCWPCQLKVNCFWWILWTRVEKKAFARSIAAYQAKGKVLICSSNETSSGKAATIGITTWLSLQQSTVVPQVSSAFCTDHIGEFNGEVVGINTLASFKSLMVALISAIPPSIAFSLLFS